MSSKWHAMHPATHQVTVSHDGGCQSETGSSLSQFPIVFFFRNENKKEIEGDQNKKLIEFPPELQMSIDVNRLNSLDGRYRLGTHIIMNEPKLVLKDAGPFSYPMN
jgi:hypothetical protein